MKNIYSLAFILLFQQSLSASELFVHIWGEAGKHARSAIGVAELPLDSPVEIELTVEIAD